MDINITVAYPWDDESRLIEFTSRISSGGFAAFVILKPSLLTPICGSMQVSKLFPCVLQVQITSEVASSNSYTIQGWTGKILHFNQPISGKMDVNMTDFYGVVFMNVLAVAVLVTSCAV